MNNRTSGLGARLSILFRPDRWKYIKRKDEDSECVFCKASRVENSFDTLTVFKSNYSMIVLNKYPYNTGHILVIPKRHEGNYLTLTQAEFEDLHNTLRLAVKAVKVKGRNVKLYVRDEDMVSLLNMPYGQEEDFLELVMRYVAQRFDWEAWRAPAPPFLDWVVSHGKRPVFLSGQLGFHPHP